MKSIELGSSDPEVVDATGFTQLLPLAAGCNLGVFLQPRRPDAACDLNAGVLGRIQRRFANAPEIQLIFMYNCNISAQAVERGYGWVLVGPNTLTIAQLRKF